MMTQTYSKILIAMVIMLLFLGILLLPQSSVAKEEASPKLPIVYFYENACGSCNPEAEFVELFNELIGEERQDVEIDLLMYNTFHDSGLEIVKRYFKDFNVPKDKQFASSMLFLGDTYLAGDSEIKERLKDEFIKAKESLVADIYEKSSAVYFHVTGCNSCMEVDKTLDKLQGVNIHKINIAEAENLKLIKKYFKAYNVPEEEQSVPIIFIGDIYLSGEDNIKQHLIEQIMAGKGLEALLPIQDEIVEDGLSGYGILGVITTGFINGLNPCSISMLLFFISMLSARNVSVLKMGFSFIAGKFIAYFLLGTLFFNLFAQLDIPWFQTTVKLILAVLVLIIAVMNIRDYFAARKEEYDKVRMQLPVFLRKKNHQWIKKFTSIQNEKIYIPVSLGLGALIAIGEFLCTGQIYLATIIAVLHNSSTFDFRAIMFFIIYGIAFILPPAILTILIYKGREIFDISEWIRARMPVIKLINAIIFIIFGVIVLIWF